MPSIDATVFLLWGRISHFLYSRSVFKVTSRLKSSLQVATSTQAKEWEPFPQRAVYTGTAVSLMVSVCQGLLIIAFLVTSSLFPPFFVNTWACQVSTSPASVSAAVTTSVLSYTVGITSASLSLSIGGSTVSLPDWLFCEPPVSSEAPAEVQPAAAAKKRNSAPNTPANIFFI